MNAADGIFTAIRAGDTDTIRRLLAADPALTGARTDEGISAVLLARYHGRMDALDLLLAAAPALDIFEASATGRTGRVAELLEVDPALAAAYAADGFTALHLAAFFGHEESARLLLAHGAKVNAVARNAMRVMPLHSAAAGPHLAICAILVAHGADVNARQHGGWTPLHEAAEHGDQALVEMLLAAGADPALRLDDGRTVAEIAAAAGHMELAERLRTVAAA